MRPAWDSHVTVVRNEEPLQKEVWERYNGKQVNFDYGHQIFTDGKYYWVNVVCEKLLDIRVELGLSRDPEFPLHLSIGHGS